MTTRNTVKHLLKIKHKVNVNLGSSDAPMTGFINVDMQDLPGVDVVCDLESFPWPFPDESVDLLVASQLIEHIEPHGGIFIKFMDEAWRILKPKGQFMIATPYAGSIGYYQDPTHCNPCNELTFEYFDPLGAMSSGELYKNYRPKPWHILANDFYPNGNLEVLLEKRPDIPEYHKSTAEGANVLRKKEISFYEKK